jgi:hypothetical protein
MPPKEHDTTNLIITLGLMDRNHPEKDAVTDELLDRADFYNIADKYRYQFKTEVEELLRAKQHKAELADAIAKIKKRLPEISDDAARTMALGEREPM